MVGNSPCEKAELVEKKENPSRASFKCDVNICSKVVEGIVRSGIKSKPQTSLEWQTDIEFRQRTSGVAGFEWLISPRRAEIGSCVASLFQAESGITELYLTKSDPGWLGITPLTHSIAQAYSSSPTTALLPSFPHLKLPSPLHSGT
jgi:hypothetical protein